MLSSKPRLTLPSAVLLCLAGCATPAPRSDGGGCAALALVPIDQVTRDKLAAEIAAAPADAVWPEQVAGYVALRAGVRACQGVRS